MPRKWKPEEVEYQRQYFKNNLKFVNVPFNQKTPEDSELLDYLNSLEEKKATYIKRLIREDMEKKRP